MRLILLVLGGLIALVAEASVDWAPAPETYKLDNDDIIEVRDGGQATADQYLLTTTDYQQFILEFEAERIGEVGERPRSIIVWSVDKDDLANRQAFFLDLSALRPGQKISVRVVVFGGRSALYLANKLVSNTPVVYGSPPVAGKVGFLHYYNYAYRYSKVKLTSLDTANLPTPTNLRGKLGPGGVLRLSWNMPTPLAQVLTYRLYRTVGGEEVTATSSHFWDEVGALEYVDTSLRSREIVRYAVAAVGGDGTNGPLSHPFILRTPSLALPTAPQHVSATRRLDGTVRIRWELAPDSRRDGVQVFGGRTEAEALSARAQPLTTRLPSFARETLTPSDCTEFVAVAALDPDGRPTPRSVVAVAPSAPTVPNRSRIPEHHPYLLYDVDQISRARDLIQREEWARQLVEDRRQAADTMIAISATIPTEPTDGQSTLANRLLELGLIYQLTGDERYAQWVREALVGYAQLYPKLPAMNGRVRLAKTLSGLYEAIWFVPLVCAYDLIYDSPSMNDADRALIDRDLIRLGAELFWVKDYADPRDNRPADLHYKCYNFQAWFDAAVGLAGLLLRDADMVEYAIDGPYGLKHLLAHDVHDDGLFWERSLGYHGFVLQALFPLLQAGTHCGLDLWGLAVVDDHNTDREPLANYTLADGDNGPKSLRLMLDAPFYFTFPDFTWPVVADSGAGPLSAQDWYRAGWERFRDPKYAWLLNRKPTSSPKAGWEGEQDAAAQVRIAYDDEYLYVSARVSDQVVRNSHADPETAWAGDALWVGMKSSQSVGGSYDFIYGLTTGDFAAVAPLPVIFTRAGLPINKLSMAQLAVVRTTTGYDLEAGLPLAELQSPDGQTDSSLIPMTGGRWTIDFVLYDSDQRSGETTKEKMIGWACVNDRYDSTQGGSIVFNADAVAEKTVAAPFVPHLTIDGDLSDWDELTATPAYIGTGSAIMHDTPSTGPGLTDLLYERPPVGSGDFHLNVPGFANNGILTEGCSLYPSTGFALLRSQLGANGLAPLDSTAVNLTYGPYGGGHGHPDKLSIVLYGHGMHLIPDFGSCGYESPEKSQWTAQTISHNTVTVDQASQLPADSIESTWPCDSSEQQARGFLGCFHGDPLLKAAQAWDLSTYPGVDQRRTLALVGDTVFDFFQLASAEKHTYDYTLHVALPLQDTASNLSPLVDPLSTKLGYQHIHQAKGSQLTADTIRTTWAEADKRLVLTTAPVTDTQLIIAESITTALDRLMPMQILRRETTTTTFATIMEPLPAGRTNTTWQWISGMGCLAASDNAGRLIAWSPEPSKTCRAQDLIFTGVMAAQSSEGLSLVHGRYLKIGELCLQANQPVSLFIKHTAQQPVEVILGYASAANIAITWCGHTQRLNAKPRQTYPLSLP